MAEHRDPPPSRGQRAQPPRGEHSVQAILDDLEQLADGLHLRARDQEVAERAQAEYAAVTLMSKIHASIGREITLALAGSFPLRGVVERTGDGWLLLADPAGPEWLIPVGSVRSLRGLSAKSVAAEALGVSRSLTWRSVVRGLIVDGAPCGLLLDDAHVVRVRLVRAGADFLEAQVGDQETVAVPWAALRAIRCGVL